MIRTSILASAALSILFSTACDKASDNQKKVDNAQATATDKVTAATVEARQKIDNAVAEADRKTAEAQASFTKMREDYRHQTMTDLADLDQKVTNLEAKEKTLSGRAKADLDVRLRQIRLHRDTFAAEYKALESASAATWDETKARLDREMVALKALVDRS